MDIKVKDNCHCNFIFPACTKITTSTLTSNLPFYISIKSQTTGTPVTVPISLFIKHKYDINSYVSLYIAALPTKDTMLTKNIILYLILILQRLQDTHDIKKKNVNSSKNIIHYTDTSNYSNYPLCKYISFEIHKM